MTYISNNFDEEYFSAKKWTSFDDEESYLELQSQLRELKRLTRKPEQVKAHLPVAIARNEQVKKRKHYAFVAIASILSSLVFLLALIFGGGITSEFPLSFVVAFFISFVAAVAFYAEYRSSLGGRISS